MKKLFIVLAVASLGFVACNNEAEVKPSTEDSAKNAIDSAANQTKDSLNAVNQANDSLKNVVDSAAKAAKDSVKH